MLKNYVLWVTV